MNDSHIDSVKLGILLGAVAVAAFVVFLLVVVR